MTLAVSSRDGCVRFSVRVQPRAARDEIVGEYGNALRIRLASPPVDGAANESLVVFLADTFNVPRRAVRLVSGHASRTKVIEVDGISESDVTRLARG